MKSYGSPRVHKELKKAGVKCGRNRVADMMRALGYNSPEDYEKMRVVA